jgi:hypothetical protein
MDRCLICRPDRGCKHGILKDSCRDCGGRNCACGSGKRKDRCTICKGDSLLCSHNKLKLQCKDCNPTAFCELHGCLKATCRQCCKRACEHSKNKDSCITCSPNSFCEHRRRKDLCTECKDAVNICSHGKRKWLCVECSGTSLCKHKKQKQSCLECGGVDFCPCGIKKWFCSEHDGSALCIYCKFNVGRDKYKEHCLHCFRNLYPEEPVIRNFKTKENEVVSLIKARFPNFTMIHDKKIYGGCSSRRPDLLIDMGTHVVIIEIDEHAHGKYQTICEENRLIEILQDIYPQKLVLIRFNPDAYTDENGKKIKSCWSLHGTLNIFTVKTEQKRDWNNRINRLFAEVDHHTKNCPEKQKNIVYLFYDHKVTEE